MWLEPWVCSAGPRAPVGGGAQADGDPRHAGQRADQADEGGGAEAAAELLVAGGEVDDLDAGPVGVGDHRAQDRGVAQIVLLDGLGAVDGDFPGALGGGIAGLQPAQQRAEHRVGIDTRRAGPDEAAAAVDQGADGAVADREEVEVLRHLVRSQLLIGSAHPGESRDPRWNGSKAAP
jgi:hypothetical protein